MPTTHKACYGTMFPSLLDPRSAQAKTGKVFSFDVGKVQGLVPPGRRVVVNLEQWDDCVACPVFETCHRLCSSKLSLETAFFRHA